MSEQKSQTEKTRLICEILDKIENTNFLEVISKKNDISINKCRHSFQKSLYNSSEDYLTKFLSYIKDKKTGEEIFYPVFSQIDEMLKSLGLNKDADVSDDFKNRVIDRILEGRELESINIDKNDKISNEVKEFLYFLIDKYNIKTLDLEGRLKHEKCGGRKIKILIEPYE